MTTKIPEFLNWIGWLGIAGFIFSILSMIFYNNANKPIAHRSQWHWGLFIGFLLFIISLLIGKNYPIAIVKLLSESNSYYTISMLSTTLLSFFITKFFNDGLNKGQFKIIAPILSFLFLLFLYFSFLLLNEDDDNKPLFFHAIGTILGSRFYLLYFTNYFDSHEKKVFWFDNSFPKPIFLGFYLFYVTFYYFIYYVISFKETLKNYENNTIISLTSLIISTILGFVILQLIPKIKSGISQTIILSFGVLWFLTFAFMIDFDSSLTFIPIIGIILGGSIKFWYSRVIN